jgi:glycine cleavage system transcriptional repressor
VHELAVTAIGADRPGIVAAVARVLHRRGGNLEDSAMTILGGQFAIVLLVASEDEPDELLAALQAATTELDLTVTVTRAEGRRRPLDATHLLSVYGTDRPGIVAGVTGAIAELGATITDLETQVVGDEDPVYAMVIELAAEDASALAERVEAACAALEVDHTLRTIDVETY